jgi:hypothetical protein
MFAYLPTLLLAATAVVAQNPIFSREALSVMTIHEAGQKCDAKQNLVCCSKAEKCSTVDIGSKCHLPCT